MSRRRQKAWRRRRLEHGQRKEHVRRVSRRQKTSQPMHDTLRSPTSMMQQELAPAQPQQSPMATRRTRSERAAMTAAAPTKMAFLVARAATRKCVFVESVSLEMTFRPVARVAGLLLPRPAYRRRAAPTPGARAARTRSSRSRRPLCSRCARSSLAAWRLVGCRWWLRRVREYALVRLGEGHRVVLVVGHVQERRGACHRATRGGHLERVQGRLRGVV